MLISRTAPPWYFVKTRHQAAKLRQCVAAKLLSSGSSSGSEARARLLISCSFGFSLAFNFVLVFNAWAESSPNKSQMQGDGGFSFVWAKTCPEVLMHELLLANVARQDEQVFVAPSVSVPTSFNAWVFARQCLYSSLFIDFYFRKEERGLLGRLEMSTFLTKIFLPKQVIKWGLNWTVWSSSSSYHNLSIFIYWFVLLLKLLNIFKIGL